MSLNPENKCAQLLNKPVPELKYGEQSLNKMFEMQKSLQERLGYDFNSLTMEQRVAYLKENWIALSDEFSEVLERLPWKPWKKYSPEAKVDWTSEEQKVETQFEIVDAFHFLINMALLVGIDGNTLWKMYAQKNAENFARQDRGY